MGHACNDYIIKNNKFIRQFEKMYKNIDDPWDQENTDHFEINNILKRIITMYGSISLNILDIGCATGYTYNVFNTFFPTSHYT